MDPQQSTNKTANNASLISLFFLFLFFYYYKLFKLNSLLVISLEPFFAKTDVMPFRAAR